MYDVENILSSHQVIVIVIQNHNQIFSHTDQPKMGLEQIGQSYSSFSQLFNFKNYSNKKKGQVQLSLKSFGNITFTQLQVFRMLIITKVSKVLTVRFKGIDEISFVWPIQKYTFTMQLQMQLPLVHIIYNNTNMYLLFNSIIYKSSNNLLII